GKLDNLKVEDTDEQSLARLLMIELLSWQFASPVRWIETQQLLFEEVDQIIEVGLAASPTLTNLAKRSMDIAGVDLPVFNVERDQDQVMLQDVQEAPAASFDVEEGEATSSTVASETPGESAAAASDNTQAIPSAEPQTVAEAPAPSAAPADGTAAADAPDLPFTAAEAIMVLFAFQNKIRQDQINDSDTVEELTNGVSSRRNQLLMDMSAEIGVPAMTVQPMLTWQPC